MYHSDAPSEHYDRVTLAWTLLLGEDLHYGYFRDPAESLATATTGLTALMAERAELRAGLEVLDVGCGTGQPACHIAENHHCQVLGISTSRSGIAQATARAATRGVAGRARFQLADAMNNGQAAASFDRAWVMESSHLMEGKGRMLAECARCLRHGGILVLCDVIRRGDLPLEYVLRHAKQFNTLRLAFGRAKMETLEYYAAWATRARLVMESSEDLTDATRPTFGNWRRNAHAHRGRVEALLGPGRVDAV